MTDRADEISGKAVAELVADLSDRRGLKSEWHRIDEEIQQEIRSTWQKAIAAALREYAKPDQERLDWLDAKRWDLQFGYSMKFRANTAYLYSDPEIGKGKTAEAITLRDAIDAAVRADKGEA